MPKVHVVIPNYNNYHLINELLFSLYKFESENIDSILVVDDCSTDEEVFTGLNWWKSNGMLPLEILNLDDNRGFLLTSNLGLKIQNIQPADDVVILIGTGVKIYGKFVSQIVQQLTQCQKSLIGGVLYTHNTGWNCFGNKIFPYLEGWFLATTISSWKDLGYFDERYVPHIFEDVDLSTTAISKGYDLIPLNSSNLIHLAGQSINYSHERDEQTRINQKKFENKWMTK